MAATSALDRDLQQALARHQAGDLIEAERLFRHVLTGAPHHPAALHHLGVIALQHGRAEPAAALLAEAAAHPPRDPLIQFHLAVKPRALKPTPTPARG